MAKTLRSRIAAVAVVALGAAVLHAAPAFATDNELIGMKTGDGVYTGVEATGYGVAGAANTVTLSVTGNAEDETTSRITVSGAGAKFISTTGGDDVTIAADGLSATVTDEADEEDVVVSTPTVGTVTVSYFTESTPGIYSADAAETVTITVSAEALSGTYDSAATKVVMQEDSTIAKTDTDDTIVAGATADLNAEVAYIKVFTFDKTGATYNAALSATISGPGLLAKGTSAPTTAEGRAVSVTAAAGVAYFAVYADGTSGVTTVTISKGTTTLATKTITFYGAAATITATQKLFYAYSGSAYDFGAMTKTGAAVVLKITDKNGVAVPGLEADIDTASTVTSVVPASTDTKCDEDEDVPGTYYCKISVLSAASGKTASVTFKKGTVVSNAVLVTLGDNINTFSWAFDKTSYAPGELVTVTVTAKDVKGNVPADDIWNGDWQLFSDIQSSAAVTFDFKKLTDTALDGATDGLTFRNGKASFSFYAPLVAGPMSLTGTTAFKAGSTATVFDESYADKKMTITATVVAPVNADLAAVKAQVATLTTTITSIQTAISTLVASTTATLTVLGAQIAKIMKKLGIK